jgi:4-amino-4-deoxy-L-arabinose transferase-like glycosyltransferase
MELKNPSSESQLHESSAGGAGWFAGGMRWVWLIAAAKLVLHLAFASRYGYFGDEMYHLACGEHLDWGYVDQPPLIAVIAWVVRHTLGESLLAIRALPALAGAGLVVLAGGLAREMGAKSFGMALAALSTACVGVLFVLHYLFTMNAFEPLFWMGCAYVVARIINTGNQKLWLWFGMLAGLGLQNKYSMAVFAGGLVLGVLLTRERRALAQKWIWIGGVIAAVIFLPNMIWNFQHNWPFFELMRNIRESGRDVQLSPVQYLASQIFLIGPDKLLIWVAGICFLFFLAKGKAYRALGWAFVFTLAFFILSKGKDYYAAPAFPVALAAGAAAIERFSERSAWRWLRFAFPSLILVTTLLFLPIGLPVLSVEGLITYIDKLPFEIPASEHGHRAAKLPHYFAWQFGWPELVEATARVYHALPPEERAKAGIIGNNFGQAGAIDLLGPKYGLPKAIGVHQSYWLWGPREYTGEIMIVLGDEPEDLRQWCESVEVGADLHPQYARPRESWYVLVCRGMKGQVRDVWPRIKNWN